METKLTGYKINKYEIYENLDFQKDDDVDDWSVGDLEDYDADLKHDKNLVTTYSMSKDKDPHKIAKELAEQEVHDYGGYPKDYTIEKAHDIDDRVLDNVLVISNRSYEIVQYEIVEIREIL